MIDSIDGCLACSIGQKIFIHAFTENDLRATGFVDTQDSLEIFQFIVGGWSSNL